MLLDANKGVSLTTSNTITIIDVIMARRPWFNSKLFNVSSVKKDKPFLIPNPKSPGWYSGSSLKAFICQARK